ncbi:37S ribosomal protein S9, mitochondrial [Boothiomyces macroporosus]|uniref:Small ribosomal subunit protein uS9m n=1 Tax=Boothiomyces macroporosus TaxID=261099 RepID=A0AAD5Y4Z2_9FUNG|nr:37S ribosomal protein S9, mitochondrial [Boothiomyces macroporosus]
MNRIKLFSRLRFIHEKPIDPAYFTGNSKYYSLVFQLNQHIRNNYLDFNQKVESKHNLWMSQHQMVQDLELRLTNDDYESLVHKLNVLSGVKDDPKILSFLNTFVSSNNSLVKPPRPEIKLDEFGRSLTVASRKTSRAQVYLVKGTGQVYVNGVNMAEYFNEIYDREKIVKPFELTKTLADYNVWALVKGGGSTGQADSIAVAIARGLTVHEPAHHPVLYENGMLKIDRRQVEKKKTGQPKARKKNTWVKR